MLLAVVPARLGGSCTALQPSGCRCAARSPLYTYTLILPSPQRKPFLRTLVVLQSVADLLCLNSVLEAPHGAAVLHGSWRSGLAWLSLRRPSTLSMDSVCLSHVATGRHRAFPGWHRLSAHLDAVCKPPGARLTAAAVLLPRQAAHWLSRACSHGAAAPGGGSLQGPGWGPQLPPGPSPAAQAHSRGSRTALWQDAGPRMLRTTLRPGCLKAPKLCTTHMSAPVSTRLHCAHKA